MNSKQIQLSTGVGHKKVLRDVLHEYENYESVNGKLWQKMDISGVEVDYLNPLTLLALLNDLSLEGARFLKEHLNRSGNRLILFNDEVRLGNQKRPDHGRKMHVFVWTTLKLVEKVKLKLVEKVKLKLV